MDCSKFKNRLRQAGSDQSTGLPEDLRRHADECEACGRILSEEAALSDLLSGSKLACPVEENWDGYLNTVMERTRAEKTSGTAVWLKRMLVPVISAAAVLYLLVQTDDFRDAELDLAYTSTLDFVMEEHDLIAADNMFSPASVYEIEVYIDDPAAEPQIRNN